MKKGKILSLLLATVGILAVTMSFVACGTTPEPEKKPDDNPPPAHTHTYKTEWSKDETNHWHDASCEHTTEKKDEAAHTFNKTECTVCGYPAPVVVKCNCETTCTLCPECGGCIQTDCTDENCIKCGDGLVSHEFEAVEAKLGKGQQNNDGSYWRLNPYIHTDECTAHREETATSTYDVCNVDKFVTGLWGSAGGTITYEITSNKKTTVTLRVLATSYNANCKISDGVKIIINDDLIESEALINILPAGRKDKFWFYYVTVGCVELEEGLNTIQFMGLAGQAGCNIARIDVMTEADVTLGFTPQTMPEPDEDGEIQDENTKWVICDEKAE